MIDIPMMFVIALLNCYPVPYLYIDNGEFTYFAPHSEYLMNEEVKMKVGQAAVHGKLTQATITCDTGE